jgi:hypothetical protein
MNKSYKIIEEIYNKWEEHLVHMDEEEVYVFTLNALADIATKERDRAERYKMESKRYRLMLQ